MGEQLCESDLLNGVLVHSAANYAVMLANMVSGTNESFVELMNAQAQTLGLTDTTYVDVTGLSTTMSPPLRPSAPRGVVDEVAAGAIDRGSNECRLALGWRRRLFYARRRYRQCDRREVRDVRWRPEGAT